MGLSELTSAAAVEQAMDEFDELGRDAFLAKYGFGQAKSYFVLRDGVRYDSKAIGAAAISYQFPDREPLRAKDFSGGEATVRRALEGLGFEIEHDITPAFAKKLFQKLEVGGLAGGGTTPHKPLLLLLVLRRLLDGEGRLSGTHELAELLRPLLAAALPDTDGPSPWQPIWRLEAELWEIWSETDELIERRPGTEPPAAIRGPGVTAGLPGPLFDVLAEDANLVREIQSDLVDRFLSTVPPAVYSHLLNPRVWWVNQGQTYRQERDSEFIWAPKLQKNGRPAAHHTAVSNVRPGDVVLHYSKKQIKAIGRVTDMPTTAPRPSDLPGALWADDGHRADVEYFELDQPIGLEELVGRPYGQGPFTGGGNVQQGYLYEVPSGWAPELKQQHSDRWPTQSPWGSSPSPAEPAKATAPNGDTDMESSALLAVIDDFKASLAKAGYHTGGDDSSLVTSFVTALATKPFVILTGLSGSGKTKLAQYFGAWLGPGRLKIVAVRPDWTNPDALLGYENGLSELTDAGHAWNVPEALQFVLKANADPQNPYLLLLDEMNLAHVERYFADVLSGMESGHPVIPNLINTDGEWRLAVGVEERLPVPRNLFVVGTVNVDETTYMFSPKVLDRANTIEFRVSTDDLTASTGVLKAPSAASPGLAAQFLQAASSSAKPTQSSEQVASALVELHRLLATHGREFGHRTYGEARRFADLHATTGGEWSTALDLQVLQKVLPKFHGSIRELAEPLDQLGAWCFVGPGGTVPADFDVTASGSSPAALPRSFDKVQRMARRLRANHFVSFAE